jgi:hypothetical protein
MATKKSLVKIGKIGISGRIAELFINAYFIIDYSFLTEIKGR